MNSGYNWGYWNAQCEQWFQKRLEEIQHGGGLLTSEEWRTRLRGQNNTKKIVSALSREAQDFIKKMSPHQ
jgi:hypothetical protein